MHQDLTGAEPNHRGQRSPGTDYGGKKPGRTGRFSLRRCLAWLLCLGILIPYSADAVRALAKDPTGLCEHHPKHTASCGYIEAEVSHVHDEDCYEIHCLFSSDASEEKDGPENSASLELEQTEQDKPQTTPEPVKGQDNPASEPADGQASDPDEQDKSDPPEEVDSQHVCTVESGCKKLVCTLPEKTPGHPCEYVCKICNPVQTVSRWEWIDEEEFLVRDEEQRVWVLALPGASQDNPLTQEDLDAMLPSQIQADLTDGPEKSLTLVWDYSALPGFPLWEGVYTLTACLPKGYELEPDVPVLSVRLELGGAELYAVYPGTRRSLTADDDFADHTVDGIQPPDTTVNLFNYKTGQAISEGNDLLPKYNNVATINEWDNGINKNRLLLFGDSMVGAGFWNLGAGAGRPWGKIHTNMKGIVNSNLGDDGYPRINLDNARKPLLDATGSTGTTDVAFLHWAEKYAGPTATADKLAAARALSTDILTNAGFTVNGDTASGGDTDKLSLAYLFDPARTELGDYKHTYTDVTGLFQLDDEGYYYYYARQNFAELNTSANGQNYFTLYDGPAVWRTDGGYDGAGHFDGDMSLGNFFPFNRANEVFDSIQTQSADGIATNILSSSEALTNNGNTVKADHHMGMTVEIDFRQPIGGMINMGGSGNKPMTFQFSGDDDVWVFVDDVLVLDIGGIHSELYGTIDFSTGDVYIGQSWRTGGKITGNSGQQSVAGDVSTQAIDYYTLKQLFQDAGVADQHSWNGNTFASNSDHTLKMFYLERGNYDSSLALRFNLQPRLYQQLKKVDQNGYPIEGVTFDLYDAEVTSSTDPDGLRCANALASTADQPVYIKQSNDTVLASLTTGPDGIANFTETDLNGNIRPFNFADRNDGSGAGQYYLLKERDAPPGYRNLPIDIVLEYEPESTMLIVANRWTTGSYASFTSTVNGNNTISYGVIDPTDGKIDPSPNNVRKEDRKNGLVVAIPSMRQDDGVWLALYGSNVNGFSASRPDKTGGSYHQDNLRKAVLKAVLYQVYEHDVDATPSWYLNWNNETQRLEGTLTDLPGRADRYQLSSDDGDMRMMYGIVMPEALQALDIDSATTTAEQRYQALGNYVQNLVNGGTSLEEAVDQAADTILGVSSAWAANRKGFSFLNVDQFNRIFRSLIYIPNEQRELRVQKVDQNGQAVNGARFSLYASRSDAEAGQNPISTGVTANVEGQDGILIFKLQPQMNGSSVADGYAKIQWANLSNTTYYLKEVQSPSGYRINETVIPVIVGIYSIYADAGTPDDGVTVMAGVGKLAQTMAKYASDGDVNITLRDITAYCQSQSPGSFNLNGWKDVKLENSSVVRSLNLHYKMNALVDYGLHDVDGGQTIRPFFVTDTGFIRARVRQNWQALVNADPSYGDANSNNVQKDNLGDTDITSLFSLLNIVVVTDQTDTDTETGTLTISKRLTGPGLTDSDYTKNFEFQIALTEPDGNPLTGQYYFYGTDKSGYIESGKEFPLHHDESITILGLPAGTKYTVEEIGANSDGWYVFPKSGKIEGTVSAHQAHVAAFQNSKQPFSSVGGLTLSKTVTGSNPDTAKQFRFTITFANESGTPLLGEFSYTGSQSGKISSGGTVLLRHDEFITIQTLPAGTNYRITESDADGYTVTSSGDVGQIPDGEIVSSSFINHKEGNPPDDEDGDGTLIVRKVLSGSQSSQSDVFHFTVSISPAWNGTFGDLTFVNGVASFTLKGGEQIFIRNLPAGTKYSVTEIDAGQNGYQSTSDGAAGTIPGRGTVTASFLNHKGPERPPKRIPGTGDSSQPGIWISMGLCAAAAVCLTVLTKRKGH